MASTILYTLFWKEFLLCFKRGDLVSFEKKNLCHYRNIKTFVKVNGKRFLKN